MNRPGFMVYKCRRCGGLVPDEGFGVSDLIGGEPCGPTCCYPNKPEVTP